jgi:hypothetical protein
MDSYEESLKPLFHEAEVSGKWFRSYYQNLWFSPTELRMAQARGEMRWGAVNWELRDPSERLAVLEQQALHAAEAVLSFRARINQAKLVKA